MKSSKPGVRWAIQQLEQESPPCPARPNNTRWPTRTTYLIIARRDEVPPVGMQLHRVDVPAVAEQRRLEVKHAAAARVARRYVPDGLCVTVDPLCLPRRATRDGSRGGSIPAPPVPQPHRPVARRARKHPPVAGGGHIPHT